MTRARLWAGALVILAFAVFAVQSLRAAMNPYVTFAQAAASSRTVQVMGHLSSKGAIFYDLDSRNLHFTMTDQEGNEAQVVFAGAKPDNFEHADSLVVVGRFRGQVFWAHRLLVKCPSKYQDQDRGR
ncbi:MAG: cytochrome c maturation protein CcmE [Bacillota bacterium]